MPEYLAPGVYVEETSFRTKSIEGVSTSTAAFVGPTRFGPTWGSPELLTSVADFERIYGSLDPLTFEDGNGSIPNYLAQAVRAFFNNGGQRLYVSRTFHPGATDGHAQTTITAGSPLQGESITLSARYPGSGGNLTVTFSVFAGQNVLTSVAGASAIRNVSPYDVVWISHLSSPLGSGGALYWAESYRDLNNNPAWRFHPQSGPARELSSLVAGFDDVRVLEASVQVSYPDSTPRDDFYDGVAFDPRNSNSFATLFAKKPGSRQQELIEPLIFLYSSNTPTAGIEIAQIMLNQIALNQIPPVDASQFVPQLIAGKTGQLTRALSGGSDGFRPRAADFEGFEDPDNSQIKTGLKALEDVTDVSIVAAPGSSFGGESNDYKDDALTIMDSLIAHCENMRYRIAVCDSADNQTVSQVTAYRARIDSSYAALYYPWVRIVDPITGLEGNFPPSGYICGIYARNDVANGVHKAPANEIVTDAIGFELLLNKAQQDVLNPEGVNCFRFFEGRGYRLWGARTATSDAEWKYVNLRRYMNYLKQSIDVGTQFAVFQNNGPDLWGQITQLITDFLYNEFRSGRLFGTKKEEAFFVRCDMTTMTQNDLDNGRLVCLIGVALLRPAEFVIFRIGQFTASAQQ